MRNNVWEGMLDADMNARYWGCITRRFTNRDRNLKIFLAIMSSGTVAGWSIWGTIPPLWQILSAVSAVVAVSLPILNYQEMIKRVSDAAGKWLQIQADYEMLWTEIKDSHTTIDVKRYQDIKKREFIVKAAESALPYDAELLLESRNAVMISRGLKR